MERLYALIVLTCMSSADGVMLPSIFQNQMVLQTPTAALFGYAAPGESVVVNMSVPLHDIATYTAVADSASGRWSVAVTVPADDQTPTGVTFSIAAASDSSPTVITGAAFGDVLLCNGQSNMVLSVAAATTTDGRRSPPSPVVQNVTWPLIRLFSVITANASTPQRDLPPFVESWHSEACAWVYVVNTTIPMPTPTLVCQTWQVAAPGVTDIFSAECFYTALELMAQGAIPGKSVRVFRSFEPVLPTLRPIILCQLSLAPQLGGRSASSSPPSLGRRWRRGFRPRHSTAALPRWPHLTIPSQQRSPPQGLAQGCRASPPSRPASGMR